MEEQIQDSSNQEQSSAVAKSIVIFGKHDYIVKNAQNLLTNGGYSVVGFVELEMARMYLAANSCDLLFFAGSVDPHDRILLAGIIEKEKPTTKIHDHFGGPATILTEVDALMA